MTIILNLEVRYLYICILNIDSYLVYFLNVTEYLFKIMLYLPLMYRPNLSDADS